MNFVFFTAVGVFLIPALLFLFLFIYFKYSYTYWKRKGVCTPDISLPFGNAKSYIKKKYGYGEFAESIYKYLKKLKLSFGGFYIFHKKCIMFIDPQIIQNVLTTDFSYFHDRQIYFDEKNDPLSANLINLTGNKWRKLRSKLSPTFSPVKIKTMFPTLLASSNELENAFNQAVSKSEPVDVQDMMARFTIDNIGTCAFGLECNSIKNPNSEFAKYGKLAVDTLFANTIWSFIALNFPFIMKMFRIPLIYKEVSKFFLDVTKQTFDYREKNKIYRNDFVDLLLKLKNTEQESLTYNELAAQSYAFFIGGYETSGISLTFTLFEISINQVIQDRMRDEIIHILRKYNGEVTYEAIMEMTYMDKVISETLRKYPPIPNINRKCTKKYKIPGTDIIIEEGVHCWISILGIHRDPEFYSDPEKFDPERFSDKEVSKRHPFTYLPFGEGPRICIGMRFGLLQTKVGLVKLLKKFRFTLNPKTNTPLKMKTIGVTMRSNTPVLLDVAPV